MTSLPYYGRRPWRGAKMSRVGSTETIDLYYTPEQHPIQGGVGGWQEVTHARAATTIEWVGRPLHRLVMDCFFDQVRKGGNVEQQLATLHRWGLPANPSDPMSEPPRITLNFGRSQQLEWVIEDIDYRAEERDGNGHRVQALVRVSLLEYRRARTAFTPLEEAQQQAAASTDGSTAQPYYGRQEPTRSYTVRSGDTLSLIAARELGDMSRWQEIATLNDLEDPDLITVGQTLLLPVA